MKLLAYNNASFNVKLEKGRLCISRGFDNNCLHLIGAFDHFSGFSNQILLQFSDFLYHPQMPCGGTFEQKIAAKFKFPSRAQSPLTPSPYLLRLDIESYIAKECPWTRKLFP